MRIAIVNTKRTARGRYILDCFSAGAARHGDRCVWLEDAKSVSHLKGIDLGIFVCLPNFHHDADPVNAFRVNVWNRLRAAGKRALVIDTGFIRNQYDYELLCRLEPRKHRFDTAKPSTFPATDRLIHYELAFEGIKGFGDHCTSAATPLDRWRALGVSLKPWREKGRSLVLLTQPLHGQSSQDCDIFSWYGKIFQELKELGCTLPIVARTHPRVDRQQSTGRKSLDYRKRVEAQLQRGQGIEWSSAPKLESVLADADTAIAYSTSAAVQAVCEGVSLVAGSAACMARPVAFGTLAEALQRPRREAPDRKSWAGGLAYSQWTCEDLRNGTAWKHYRPHALKDRKGKYR